MARRVYLGFAADRTDFTQQEFSCTCLEDADTEPVSNCEDDRDEDDHPDAACGTNVSFPHGLLVIISKLTATVYATPW